MTTNPARSDRLLDPTFVAAICSIVRMILAFTEIFDANPNIAASRDQIRAILAELETIHAALEALRDLGPHATAGVATPKLPPHRPRASRPQRQPRPARYSRIATINRRLTTPAYHLLR